MCKLQAYFITKKYKNLCVRSITIPGVKGMIDCSYFKKRKNNGKGTASQLMEGDLREVTAVNLSVTSQT